MGKTPCHYAARHSHIGVLSYLYDYSLVIVWPPVRNSEVHVHIISVGAFQSEIIMSCNAFGSVRILLFFTVLLWVDMAM